MALIDRDDLLAESRKSFCSIYQLIKEMPAVDAVEVEALKAWLYEIAMNNTDNYLGDACEEIISRLDGLRVFARERKEP